jgi:hypothetical protein
MTVYRSTVVVMMVGVGAVCLYPPPLTHCRLIIHLRTVGYLLAPDRSTEPSSRPDVLTLLRLLYHIFYAWRPGLIQNKQKNK